MKKRIIILLILTILSFKVILAEEKTNNLDDFEIQRVTEKVKDFVEPVVRKINFVNIETGDIVKTIDLLEDNPFSHLPFEKEMILYNGIQRYFYLGLKLSDVYKDFSWMYTPLYEQNKDKVIPEAKTWSFYDIGENLVTIEFSISFFQTDEEMLGKKSYVVIYDRKGTEIFKLDNVNDGISQFSTTEDGKYFAYTYGRQLYAYERMFKDDPGVKVIDTETGELILKKNYPFTQELGYISNWNNIIQYSTFKRIENSIKGLYNYILPERRVIYSSYLPVEISNRIQNFSDEGLILGKTSNRDLETELYEFERHFQKEEF